MNPVMEDPFDLSKLQCMPFQTTTHQCMEGTTIPNYSECSHRSPFPCLQITMKLCVECAFRLLKLHCIFIWNLRLSSQTYKKWNNMEALFYLSKETPFVGKFILFGSTFTPVQMTL